MYFLKKLVGALTMPLTFILLLVVVAGALWLLRRRRIATTLFVASAVLTYLASTDIVAGALLRPLTQRYSSPLETPPHVSYVVVLGSAYSPQPELPITASLDPDGLARIVEGVRLLRLLPGARLIVSGGSDDQRRRPPIARGYSRMAQSLGVDPASIILLEKPLDTASEAREVAALLHAEPFLLVTSADSIHRAMRLMEREGTRPIPAPATAAPLKFDWDQLIPSARALRNTEAAIHEYLGLAAISAGLD